MALVNLIYPQPELRPMSDIDILVDPRRADDAQQCLKDLGYQARSHQSGYQFDHHHLPMASHRVDKVSIHVEVHHDALSGDVTQSITLDALTEPLLGFDLGTARGHGLGHMDTLRHLCHHTFEPVAEIKLGAVADLYGYAGKYIDDIDTTRLDHEYPFVANIFRLLHYLTPLPERLRDWVSVPDAPAPAGVGYGYRGRQPDQARSRPVHSAVLVVARFLQRQAGKLHYANPAGPSSATGGEVAGAPCPGKMAR
jgi:hypothetical protein